MEFGREGLEVENGLWKGYVNRTEKWDCSKIKNFVQVERETRQQQGNDLNQRGALFNLITLIPEGIIHCTNQTHGPIQTWILIIFHTEIIETSDRASERTLIN